MDERQDQQIEVTFRLSAGLLGQLAALVAGIVGEGTGERRETAAPAPETQPARGPEETARGNFDFARFQELSAQAAEPDLPQQGETNTAGPVLTARAAERPAPEAAPPEGAEAPAVTDLPAPERPDYQVEAAGPEPATPAPWPAMERDAAAESARDDAERLSRRFERDSRRYDGGFSMY